MINRNDMSKQLPKRLYIPTTTSNFGTFMATESISPKAFYAERRFGASRFVGVKPNALENRILLYEKCPIFDVDNSEGEHYPLIIEIDTQRLPEGTIQEEEGVFFADCTIYLSPWSTRFIFQEEVARQDAMSRAERNVKCKLWPLYEKRCVIASEAKVECEAWKDTHFTDREALSRDAISKDRKINKLKGCLYGYVLGKMKSVSEDGARLKSDARELERQVSSIANAGGFRNEQEREELKRRYLNVNYGFYAVSAKKEWEKVCEGHDVDFLAKRARGREEEWNAFVNYVKTVINREIYQLMEFSLVETDPEKRNEYWSKLDSEVAKALQHTPPNVKALPEVQSLKITQIENDEFLRRLLDAFLDEGYMGDEYESSHKEDYPKMVESLLKEKMGDEWENSKEKRYLDSLMKMLKNPMVQFDINDIDGSYALALKSFAAFCWRGPEIGKLDSLLEKEEISQLQIAYALWGSVFGFSDMPKTLTDELFASSYKIGAIYKRIFQLTVGIDLGVTSKEDNLKETKDAPGSSEMSKGNLQDEEESPESEKKTGDEINGKDMDSMGDGITEQEVMDDLKKHLSGAQEERREQRKCEEKDPITQKVIEIEEKFKDMKEKVEKWLEKNGSEVSGRVRSQLMKNIDHLLGQNTLRDSIVKNQGKSYDLITHLQNLCFPNKKNNPYMIKGKCTEEEERVIKKDLIKYLRTMYE